MVVGSSAGEYIYEFLASENPWIGILKSNKILVKLSQKYDPQEKMYIVITYIAFQDYFFKDLSYKTE